MGSESTTTGTAPARTMAAAQEMMVNVGRMTSSPDPIFRAAIAASRATEPLRLLRLFYGELILKCQFNKLRNRKLLKLRKPYPSLLINLSLLLIPSTVPLVVLPSK